MKKGLFFLVPLALLFIFLGASAPYLKAPLALSIDGEEIYRGEIKIEPSRKMRAEKYGGYLPFYNKLRARYEAKEALNYISRGLGDFLSSECERRKTDPLSATLEWTKKLSSPFIYYEERAGSEVPLDEIGRAAMKSLDEGRAAAVRSRAVPPLLSLCDLKRRTRLMGKFSTSFYTSGNSRRHNISLAEEAINGTVLLPGERFSFNESVGARTAERGYLEANIVLNGAFVKGVGGGVCQVSTTLYNAVLLSGLPVTKAAAHSCPVSYVSPSRDCTVSSAIDFSFENDTDFPLYVASEIRDGTITFALYGDKKEGEFSLESEIVRRIPFSRVTADGKKAPIGAKVLSEGREGIESRLFLIRKINGVSEKKEIRANYYPPKNAICEEIPSSESICIGRKNALTPW